MMATIDGKGQPNAETSTVVNPVQVNEIDLGEIAEKQNAGNKNDISPKDKLKFAQRVLLAIFMLAVLAGFARIWASDPAGTDIFDAATTLLLPVVTLVLGFYFGRNDNSDTSNSESGE
jgi:hypothetical protein